MLVQERMTGNPITATVNTSHSEAVGLMRQHRIRRLPVLDLAGRLVGIVVEKDILSTAPSPATVLSIYEVHALLSKLRLADIMTTPVLTVTEDCPVEEAARIMITHRIGCLPVMRGATLVGVITETDIFKTLAEALGAGEPGVRITVRTQRQRGVLHHLTGHVADAGGAIASMLTINEPDGEHKRVTLKVLGARPDQLQAALSAYADLDLTDLRLIEKPFEPLPLGV